MYSIGANFSAAGIDFYWPETNDSNTTITITINKNKGPDQTTSDNLKERDKQWLTIVSPDDWRINLKNFKERFQLQDDKQIPDYEIETAPTDLVDQLRVEVHVHL